MFKRATAFYYIIERRNEIDLKNTGMGREIENILTKKEKNSSLKFTRFDFYQNRANIRPKGEREFPIDLRRSFAFDRHPFTSLCKMFRATSTLNDKRHSKFSPFFFFSYQNATIIHNKNGNFNEEDLRYSFRQISQNGNKNFYFIITRYFIKLAYLCFDKFKNFFENICIYT